MKYYLYDKETSSFVKYAIHYYYHGIYSKIDFYLTKDSNDAFKYKNNKIESILKETSEHMYDLDSDGNDDGFCEFIDEEIALNLLKQFFDKDKYIILSEDDLSLLNIIK